ncbi:hemolysin XhlA family protein [Bacillus subtilis]|uniref:hemolysin XhlA family protein n=1 Tax=Bacillus sp. AtDRG31 TaxID=1938894 RepID=UPI000943BEE4|nr:MULTISPECIES: hemolysin XhlA family protein [Bacillus]MDK2600149.1 hemolysin XhlA family protein [Bacillus stercoris]KAA0931189.1 protein xhlA [Bacillus sp. ANT_WA51]MBP3048621.1 hemolysin XhlA family protein [Bacillus subtilis subsp. subtilis]MCG3229787.1 hemolysin XhlA family protein [Bacillus subtilis]MCM3060604.1 hemolysin XhlA family protein [Bacillus subtilis]
MTEVPDVNVIQKEMAEFKLEQKSLERRVSSLERSSDRQDQQIMSLNEKLNKIEENTTWIKRTITGAIITAISTGIIGGAIAIFYTVLQK